MTAKSMDRFKDRLNRALFKQENLPEFGGDEKLQRQYEECELISTGLSTVSKAIQSNQIYDRVSPDGADIEKKYDSWKMKYPSYKIAQNMITAAEKLDTQFRTESCSSSNGPGAISYTSNNQQPLPTPSSERDISTEMSHPLSRMYKETAKEMEFMAKQQFTFENEVNATVLGKFTDFFQTFESVNNTLRQLQRHCVDVQTSERNLEEARSRVTRFDSGSDNGQTLSKLQGKLEHADKIHKHNVERVQKERDLLNQGVLGFVRSETEIGNSLIKYVTLCQDYHKNCFEILNRLAPELEKWRDKSSLLPPFGTSLEKHLTQTRRKIALPIELTTSWLHHNEAYKEQGVFRVGGNMKVVRLLQEKIDRFQAVEDDFAESTTMTTLLKSYLRSLPNSLFTVSGLQKLKDAYMTCSKKGADESAIVWRFADVIESLPAANKDNLRPIFSILHEVLMNQSENKMTADNIGTCIGPSFDSEKLELKPGIDFGSLDLQQTANYIVAILVKHAPRIFKLEEDPIQFRSVSDVLNPDMNPSIKMVPLDERDNVENQQDSNEPPQPTPRKGVHRRVHSSDKVLGPSQAAPLPPKPLAPEQLAGGSGKKKAPKAPSTSGSKSSLLDGCGDNTEYVEIGPPVELELSHSSDNLTNGNSAAPINSSLAHAEPQTPAATADRHSKLIEASKPKPSPRSFRVPRPTVAPPPPPASGASSPLNESKRIDLQQNVEQNPASFSPETENNYVPSLDNTNSTHF